MDNARIYQEEQKARKYLETIVDISPTSIVVLDAGTGALIMSNEETRRIAGTDLREEVSIEDIIKGAVVRNRSGIETPLDEFLVSHRHGSRPYSSSEEVELTFANRREVSVLVNVKPLRSDDRNSGSVIATLQDLTPLDDLERLRAEFLGMVSHELRTPLTSIKGSAATLLSSLSFLDPAETLQFIRIIDDQSDHMRDLITQLSGCGQNRNGNPVGKS